MYRHVTRRGNFLRWLKFWISDGWWANLADKKGWPDWAWPPEWIISILCRLLTLGKHEPENDMCMKPEHRFCLWCGKSMPYVSVPKFEERWIKK